MKKDISYVVKNNLCIGCGTCVSICPTGSIDIYIDKKKGTYFPEIDTNKCKNCGLCYKICSGHEVNFDKLNNEFFGKIPDEILIGNYINCYVGNATDAYIKKNSSSGGLITELLIFALENGLIDGVLVTKMKKSSPLEPEPFIARTREQIIEASKSKYCPVPANIGLKEILESKENEKFAVVGLPCHIQGIRKAQITNKTLSKKIIMCIGIFCSHIDNFFATEFILKWNHISKKDVKKIDYRGNGWPGFMSIELKDGRLKKIPYKEYITVHELYMFTPQRCKSCCDGISELSDISVGDAWGIKSINNENEGNGTALCISRTENGERLLHECFKNKKININRIDVSHVLNSQGLLSNNKIKHSKAAIGILSFCRKEYPNFIKKTIDSKKLDPGLKDYVMWLLLDTHRSIFSKKILWVLGAKLLPIEIKLMKKMKLKR